MGTFGLREGGGGDLFAPKNSSIVDVVFVLHPEVIQRGNLGHVT